MGSTLEHLFADGQFIYELDDDDFTALQELVEEERVRRGARQVNAIASDEYHPVIGFDGDAFDTMDAIIDRLRGFGVTLFFPDGTETEAVLIGNAYDDENERAVCRFFRVTDDEYPGLDEILDAETETAFVTRIQVG